jgi:hypothetical protein
LRVAKRFAGCKAPAAKAGIGRRPIDRSKPGLFKPLSLDAIYHRCKMAAPTQQVGQSWRTEACHST